ncbi:MAG TPA: threonine--tRNA ligase, partial [Verrucomicrobiae bacterium]|nr:threonine--tRNA ligase [Verrucomicrobiae bacterium]
MKNENENLNNLRHSAAHLLAAAVMKLWPNTKRTIGPAIEDGFYFDFEFANPISEKDFPKIEKKMKEILKTWDKFEKHELSKDDAKKEYPDNPYKHELIDEFSAGGEKLSFYKSGDYWDLCRGGHVDNPKKELQHFKLLKLAGAYWRGSEKNQMLTRIYGTVFPTQEELDNYVKQLEEAEKRDHKKLGPQLDLFTFSELVGPGLPLWTPKGTLVRNILDDFVWELRRARGYQKVEIPHITKKELYQISGHWDKFKNELFRIETREGHEFAMKPMNCPHHIQIFNRKKWSYRELPQRYSSTTMCYRDEQTGE